MRGYALLLGTCLTVGYGYAGQVAIASSRLEAIRRVDPTFATATVQPTTPIWYGGTLAPITVRGEAGAKTAPPAQCSLPRAPREASSVRRVS